jgi:ABC-type molybdenum transport system ATPase subunit/photorepair protein PhrA
MIHRAKFQNFKALRDVEITFDSRLTVLVGPNGSGKTSVLQGIRYLNLAAQFGQPGINFNIAEVLQYVRVGADISDLVLEATFHSPKVGEISVWLGDREKLPKKVQSAFGNLALGWIVRHPEAGQANETAHRPLPAPIAGAVGVPILLRLDASKLAAPSQPNSVPPTVQPDGTGLASTLAYLALNQPERFESIVSAFKQVIGQVNRVRFDKVANAGFSEIVLFDFVGASGVKAEYASNGTLLTLGLLTVILGPQQPRLVLLDDLDHGLHPKAQMELVGVLRKLLAQYPDLQILATSHSPYILNQLEWNEVRVTGLHADGSAICARLEDHPDVERWREAMTPGEFWSHIGDDWVKKLDKAQPQQPQPVATAP